VGAIHLLRGNIERNRTSYDIEVRDGDAVFQFQEQVRIFDLETLLGLHESAGLKVLDVFGDDQLGAFDAKVSPRMVVISQKS